MEKGIQYIGAGCAQGDDHGGGGRAGRIEVVDVGKDPEPAGGGEAADPEA